MSPTPRPQTGTGPWFVRNRAAQQEVSGRQAGETSSVFNVLPSIPKTLIKSRALPHSPLPNYVFHLVLDCLLPLASLDCRARGIVWGWGQDVLGAESMPGVLLLTPKAVSV